MEALIPQFDQVFPFFGGSCSKSWIHALLLLLSTFCNFAFLTCSVKFEAQCIPFLPGGSDSVNWPRCFAVFGGSCTKSWIGAALLSSFCNSDLNLDQLILKLGLVSWWPYMGSSGMMSVQCNLAPWDTPCTLRHSLCGKELHLFPYETNGLSRTG